MTVRERIVQRAVAEIGAGRRSEYWRGAAGRDPGRHVAWCGAFALWCLKQEGVATHAQWIFPSEARRLSGFVGPLRLKPTADPAAGDIVYIDQPYQHHALFDFERDGYVHSIDGNQPGVKAQRRLRRAITHIYSIQPLLGEIETQPQPLAPPLPTLRIGATGNAVRELQQLLGPALQADGSFGPRTLSQLLAFQRSNGLLDDGVCGPATWAKLMEARNGP